MNQELNNYSYDVIDIYDMETIQMQIVQELLTMDSSASSFMEPLGGHEEGHNENEDFKYV